MTARNDATPSSPFSADQLELLSYLMEEEGLEPSQPEAIPHRAPEQELPLSFAQQRLWFLDQFQPNSAVYNVPAYYRIRGTLDVPALERSLSEILKRHEALRTLFAARAGEPVQIIAPEEAVNLRVTDLRHHSKARRAAALHNLVSKEARRPFDLAWGPLLRTRLIRLHDQEYLFLVTLHHIATDAWSMEIFWRELSSLYASFAAGGPASLPELPIQYADFALWQRRTLQDDRLAADLDYWRENLANLPAVVLPFSHTRPSLQTYRGERLSIRLPQSLSDALWELSRRTETTRFMILLAAFKILLHRYTGQDDLVVGTPTANRNRLEVENLIGFFTNTLVLRTNLTGNPTFQEALARVREVALQAFAHQELPFENLVEALKPDRNLNHNPLFQILFIFRDAPPSPQLSDLTVLPLEVDNKTAKFDLTLSVAEHVDWLTVSIEYNTDLFDADAIERMLGHYEQLLKGLVLSPDQPLRQLPLLTKFERSQLLLDWNDTSSAVEPDQCVHHLFEEQAAQTPEAVAISFPSGSRDYPAGQLTYRQLDEQANQLAHYLQGQGVGPDVLVGLCLDRSPEMIVALLGILKAGGAYVPLDPTYPQERLGLMLDDAQVSLLLTERRHLSTIPAPKKQPIGRGAWGVSPHPSFFLLEPGQRPRGVASKRKVLCLDADKEAIGRESRSAPAGGVTVDHLIYVIYTSGSTGQPKGVALPHRALSNLISWQLDQSTLAEGARTLQFTSLSFDVSAQEIFATLCSGGQLVLIDERTRRDFERLTAFACEQKIDRLFLPFVALQQLAETASALKLWPSHLKEVITAGERLQITQPIIDLFSHLTAGRLHNHYGPTESHVVTAFTLSGSPAGWPALPLIGRPIANSQIYLLDQHLQPVPIGLPGELYIGGHNLARGYLNRPDLTDEKFIKHPFSSRPGSRLYKTGDLARFLPDGGIEFLGRTDDQVKIRGYRVEPGEIEVALSRHPAVREAVVVARQEDSGHKRLIAYVVFRPDNKASVGELQSFSASRLPGYMVPATIVLLDDLPLTPSGKADRLALPEPDQWPRTLDNQFVAPRTELEEQLVGIWKALLGVETVGIQDDFFELGGHSLLAIRLFALIEKSFGSKLPLATLFQSPTVEQLAARLHEEEITPAWTPLVPIKTGGSRTPLFLVHGIGGGVIDYAYLARNLSPDQPVYGVQGRGMDGLQEPDTDIETMAAHNIEALKTVQPQGPYFLGGYCFGGNVAFEMAQQLHAGGETVSLLAIIDAVPPNFGYGQVHWGPSFAFNFVTNFPYRLREYFRLNPATVVNRVRRKIRSIKRRALRRMSPRRSSEPEAVDLAEVLDNVADLPEHRRKLKEIHLQALRNYRSQIYPGRITLFRAQARQFFCSFDPFMCWGGLTTQNVELIVVPGSHDNLHLEPHAQILGAKLEASLEQAKRPELDNSA